MPDLGLEVLFKGKNMLRLLGGLGVALRISAISVLISLPLGILLGVLMTFKNPILKAILRVYLEIIRIMPQMVLLFLVYFGTTRAFGWDLPGETASIIVFVLWGTAEMSDLVRGALIAIPKHQYEGSEALGMSRAQTYWYIIIPQTVRRLIPLSINLITRMIKTTSLVLMIGVVEVLKVSQQIIEANRIEYLQTGKVDIILANFTVTPERAEEVDFALPYMNVALGVISPDSNVITSLDNWNADDQMIVISGTTAETYLVKNYPDIPLQKYDSYATAQNALENGNGVAWANDNTEVIAFAKQNPGYTVGIPSLGSQDTIAPAVSKGNTTLLDWINDEIKSLADEQFFHKDYEETLVDTYGIDYEDELVVEGGVTNA